MKRINVTIRAEQYEAIAERGLNASGLIRGLLDDHFSEQKIVFSVSPHTRAVYEQVISNLGGHDSDLERFFLRAMHEYLVEKAADIDALRQLILSHDAQSGDTGEESTQGKHDDEKEN